MGGVGFSLNNAISRGNLKTFSIVVITCFCIHCVGILISFFTGVQYDALGKILSLLVSGAQMLLFFLMIRVYDYNNRFNPALAMVIGSAYTLLGWIVSTIRGYSPSYTARGWIMILISFALTAVFILRYLNVMENNLAEYIIMGIAALNLVDQLVYFLQALSSYMTALSFLAYLSSFAYWIMLLFIIIAARRQRVQQY